MPDLTREQAQFITEQYPHVKVVKQTNYKLVGKDYELQDNEEYFPVNEEETSSTEYNGEFENKIMANLDFIMGDYKNYFLPYEKIVLVRLIRFVSGGKLSLGPIYSIADFLTKDKEQYVKEMEERITNSPVIHNTQINHFKQATKPLLTELLIVASSDKLTKDEAEQLAELSIS